MTFNRVVTVFGAYGHTGRFVVAELRKRGWIPILSGRNAARLMEMRGANSSLEIRVADVENPKSLEAAISGGSAVINCAGPFLDTAIPVIQVATHLGIPYLDIAAEQAAVLRVFERFGDDPKASNVVIAPAMAFYGGLGDLMATAAMGDWNSADEICIAVGLDSWKPTLGTRLTGQRNQGRRFIFSNNKLERADPPPGRMWNFPSPFGEQAVVPLSLSETITISRHLRTRDVRAFMNDSPLADLRNPETPAPSPADDSGRSSQLFAMDVIARRGNQQRRVTASGRDIYWVTAPIVVEATERIVNFLSSLTPKYLTLEFPAESYSSAINR